MSARRFDDLFRDWPATSEIAVKICGITRPEDARAAAAAGADAIGLVFAPESPRRVTPRQAREIISALPVPLATVGLFVNESRERIGEIIDRLDLDAAQLHGEETPEYVRGLYGLTRAAIIKAIRVRDAASLAAAEEYRFVDAFLLDAHAGPARGGTGERFDWSLARDFAAKKRVILAGGLTPENVGEAVWQVRPAMVDVSSGVESAPRIKDPEKVLAFVTAARGAGAAT